MVVFKDITSFLLSLVQIIMHVTWVQTTSLCKLVEDCERNRLYYTNGWERHRLNFYYIYKLSFAMIKISIYRFFFFPMGAPVKRFRLLLPTSNSQETVAETKISLHQSLRIGWWWYIVSISKKKDCEFAIIGSIPPIIFGPTTNYNIQLFMISKLRIIINRASSLLFTLSNWINKTLN